MLLGRKNQERAANPFAHSTKLIRRYCPTILLGCQGVNRKISHFDQSGIMQSHDQVVASCAEDREEIEKCWDWRCCAVLNVGVSDCLVRWEQLPIHKNEKPSQLDCCPHPPALLVPPLPKNGRGLSEQHGFFFLHLREDDCQVGWGDAGLVWFLE